MLGNPPAGPESNPSTRSRNDRTQAGLNPPFSKSPNSFIAFSPAAFILGGIGIERVDTVRGSACHVADIVRIRSPTRKACSVGPTVSTTLNFKAPWAGTPLRSEKNCGQR